MRSGFLLDTNIPSEQIRPQPDLRVSNWISAQEEDSLFLSVLTIGELQKGIFLLPAGKRRTQLEHWLETDLVPRFAQRTLPLTQNIVRRWAHLSAERQMAGMPLSLADGLIAATALEHELTLVTRNVKDFSMLPLTLLNPWDAD